MILIADCGSTKIDWCVVENGEVKKQVFTSGINALLMTEEQIRESLALELAQEVAEFEIESVYYYGAGCLFDDICANVRRAIAANVPTAKTIEVHSDLVAAARALCGDREGIACILGTGSNSCFWDGEKIADNVSPLGYILGDEGSGAVLGKLLVGDVLKKQLPEELCEKFLKEYELDRQKIIESVYKRPAANRFLASLSPFLSKNIEEPAIHRLVLNAFKSFFVRNIENYKDYKNYAVSFVGSVAFYYREVLEEAAKAVDIKIGTIIKSPMEGLVKYHSN
ncbi:MAG: ATPase [Bacteroidales bacterium]|nr:ATPase [Bacteroidales bacterium]MDY4942611.1 ATPase [Candidatus Limisoma sp.]MDD7604964.1 ATPase [Bacteroidales bacterium]MDD7760944.1 ATPase [Bacteroidales bacterium]MDY5894675.1 ATPase [Candidatus Limisoma sp.]